MQQASGRPACKCSSNGAAVCASERTAAISSHTAPAVTQRSRKRDAAFTTTTPRSTAHQQANRGQTECRTTVVGGCWGGCWAGVAPRTYFNRTSCLIEAGWDSFVMLSGSGHHLFLFCAVQECTAAFLQVLGTVPPVASKAPPASSADSMISSPRTCYSSLGCRSLCINNQSRDGRCACLQPASSLQAAKPVRVLPASPLAQRPPVVRNLSDRRSRWRSSCPGSLFLTSWGRTHLRNSHLCAPC